MIRSTLIPFLTLLLSVQVHAQFDTPRLMEDISFVVDGQSRTNYYEGGFNNPVFSTADLDRDGDQDLVVLEKSEGRVYAYENGGTPGQVDYHRNDTLAAGFPLNGVTHFMHLEDINCDGTPDLFTYTPFGGAGIGLYKGRWENGILHFDVWINRLYSIGGIQIYADQTKKPEFKDVNGDGDMDIILFAQFDGTIEWYENRFMESGQQCDTFLVEQVANCWGEICECSLVSNDITLNYYPEPPCTYNPLWLPQQGQEREVQTPNRWWRHTKDTTTPGTRHAGSTLTLLDTDHDGYFEALIGDAGFDNLIFLKNNAASSNPAKDKMIEVDTAFPSYDVPVDVPVFPAAYYIDVNNDSKKDLIVASFGVNGCALGGTLDTSFNDNMVFWYKNIGTAQRDSFQLTSRQFLAAQMVDLGHMTKPVFVDYDGDGLQDIVAGRCYAYDTTKMVQRGLVWFKNTGTLTDPAFTLADNDLGGFAKHNWYGLAPAFGDLDNDGDNDLLLGTEIGYVFRFENTGSATQPQWTIRDTIINGSYASPYIVELNGDTRPDLVLGGLLGKLQYWQNTGLETSPDYTQINDFFGEVDGRNGDFYGYTVPWLGDLDRDTHLEALVGTHSGAVFLYDKLEQSLPSLPWKLVDSSYLSVPLGRMTALDVADINNDGALEMVVGNNRGGLAIFQGQKPVGIDHDNAILQARVYPNPAGQWMHIKWPRQPVTSLQLTITNAMGQVVWSQQIDAGTQMVQITTSAWPSGVYMVRVAGNAQLFQQKVVVQ